MQTSSFNLLDIIFVLQKKWKAIAIFVLLSLSITVALLFLSPKYYKSHSIVIPVNPVLADKSNLFGKNIQGLYSFFGNSDDVETIAGIVLLDTTLYQLIDEFRLINYYKCSGNSIAEKRKKCLSIFKKELNIQKRADRQLELSIYTTDAALSASIINRAVSIVQQTEKNTWSQFYKNDVLKMDSAIDALKLQFQQNENNLLKNSSAQKELIAANNKNIMEQINSFQLTANQLHLAIESIPSPLYIMEKAIPSVTPDKPLFVTNLVIVLFVSIILGSMLILLLNRK